MNNVNLNDISLFVTVVQAGSFSKAEEITAIPKSRLSRRISELEKNLGTALIGRSKKGVVLNEVGEQFYLKAKEMMQAAQLALDSVQHRLNEPSGLLRMSVSTEIGRGILMHHLAEYRERYPNVRLAVEINNKRVNMIHEGVDIALRVGVIDDENVVARKLTEIQFGLFAHQDYLQKHGTPNSPHELHQHSLLYKYDGIEWQFSHKGHQVHIQPHSSISSNDANFLGKMVADAAGIALLPIFDTMILPNMVQILPEWEIPTIPLYAVYYKNRGAVPTVQSMVAFLREKISA
ncbi:LysR substrate-binding domain-containing protein [Moraxella sp. ZJ142]|uniref:LysR family transcriptional regulator n=1 Tax=Moraxella marmotae TaxID=3344520 RepID=UPI0035D43FCA